MIVESVDYFTPAKRIEMNYTTILTGMVLLFASLSGTAQEKKQPLTVPTADTAEGLVKAMIASLKDMTAELARVQDAATALKAIAGVEAKIKESRQIEARMEKLVPPAPDVQKKLIDTYQQQIVVAAKGFEAEMTRLKASEYGKTVVRRIEELTTPPAPPRKDAEPVKK